MVDMVLGILLAVSGFGYACVVLTLRSALKRVRSGTSDEQPFVSVIIAARNEGASIESCLNAIRAQDYPEDLFEVIVADDRSDDDTPEKLDALAHAWNRLTVITIESHPPGLSPKKHALTRAIERARGDIVLQTDADCIVPPAWIAGMVRRFEPGVNMVAGVAPYVRHHGFLAGFIAHEYLWNVLLGAGSIARGLGTHASARNLGFRRAAFRRMNGYGDSAGILSGDDTLLMQRFQRADKTAVVTNPDAATQVFSEPPSTFGAFIRQRIRHMSTGRYFHPFQVIVGLLVYGFHILILLSIVLACFAAVYFPLFILLFLLKLSADMLAFRAVSRVFSLEVAWRSFVRNEFLLAVYLAVLPVLGTFLPVRWKEKN